MGLLVEALRDKVGPILVVTGAGVSLASGIPTFRGSDPGAVWASQVTDLGTVAHFRRDPAGSWAWYLSRFRALEGKQPNPAHLALAELERWQRARGLPFLLVSQNVDGLHEAAGSVELVKVHGDAGRVRCSGVGCALGAPKGTLARVELDLAAFDRDPVEANVPRCPLCGAMLRMHVLWFDENYSEHRDYQIDRVIRACKRARVTLFVGTSFSVGVTDLVLWTALGKNSRVFSIDPSGRTPSPSVVPIVEKAEVALPRLMSMLPPV